MICEDGRWMEVAQCIYWQASYWWRCTMLSPTHCGNGFKSENHRYRSRALFLQQQGKRKKKDIIRLLTLTILFQLTARSKYTRKDILIAQ
jgi:hypothetical protein